MKVIHDIFYIVDVVHAYQIQSNSSIYIEFSNAPLFNLEILFENGNL